MNCNCDVEEICDDLVCDVAYDDLQKWQADVCLRVWKENDDNELVINEESRREEIAKRAYQLWQETGSDELTNWLQAEIDVDVALFD